MREPDDLVLHLVEREGVTVVDVCENLFVRLLVAGGFGEVEAHESDEGVDVLDGHGLYVAELRSRGVQKENFRPRRCTTVRRVDLDFRKHFVEGCERFCLFLEEPPKPVLEHSVRGFAVAGEPRFAHRAMQLLLIVGQMFPFNNG